MSYSLRLCALVREKSCSKLVNEEWNGNQGEEHTRFSAVRDWGCLRNPLGYFVTWNVAHEAHFCEGSREDLKVRTSIGNFKQLNLYEACAYFWLEHLFYYLHKAFCSLIDSIRMHCTQPGRQTTSSMILNSENNNSVWNEEELQLLTADVASTYITDDFKALLHDRVERGSKAAHRFVRTGQFRRDHVLTLWQKVLLLIQQLQTSKATHSQK